MAAVSDRNGTPKQQQQQTTLTHTERRHYEPEFCASDPKWTCWMGRPQHVEKAALPVAVATVVLGLVVLLLVVFLLRPLHFKLFFACLFVLLCAVSGMAILASRRQHDALFLPYLFLLWLLNILTFALCFLLLPLIIVPDFWRKSVLGAFGMAEGGHPVAVVRLITLAGTVLSFLFLCVLTYFNYTMLRARNFAIARRGALRKGHGGGEAHAMVERKKQRRKTTDGRRVRVASPEGTNIDEAPPSERH